MRGGGTEARGRAGSGAAFSLTYISASQNQHSCQQAVEVGIHPHTHKNRTTDHHTHKHTDTAALKYVTKPQDVHDTKTSVPAIASKSRSLQCSFMTL